MDIKDYCIKEKSETQKKWEKVFENIMRQQGIYDAFYLGQINAIETLSDYIDKDVCIGYLNQFVTAEDVSESVKELASNLMKKYRKELKFEL